MLHNSYQNYKQQKAIETKLEIEYEQFLIDSTAKTETSIETGEPAKH